MQPSPWSEEGKQFPGLGDPSVKDFGSLDRNWENYVRSSAPCMTAPEICRVRDRDTSASTTRVRSWTVRANRGDSSPLTPLAGKMGTADLQTPAPYYTPFTFTGGHWHRWHTRKVDQTGVAIPKEFDEREAKEKCVVGHSRCPSSTPSHQLGA